MQATTLKDKVNLSHAKAVRRSGEQLKVTRIELARRLDLSPKAIEKYESGRAIIDEGKLQSILKALDLRLEDFEKNQARKRLWPQEEKQNRLLKSRSTELSSNYHQRGEGIKNPEAHEKLDPRSGFGTLRTL